MKITIIPAVVAVMLVTASAGAQDILQYETGPEQQRGISVIALDPVSVGAVVTNAPYTAEGVTEVTQTLADGNRIERRTSTAIARASDGRTRREQQGFAIGSFVGQNEQPIVTITDPASGVHITLNYDLKVAFRMKPGRITIARPPAGSRAGSAGGVFGSRGAGIGVGPRPPIEAGQRVMPPPGPFDEAVIALEPAETPWGAESKTEQLEPRTIEGLRAEGTRTTSTIPAGALGNTLPIEIVTERWFSPELQVVLMTHRSDPRVGETIYRLTNIVRGEPSPDLFKVPADFRIEEMKP